MCCSVNDDQKDTHGTNSLPHSNKLISKDWQYLIEYGFERWHREVNRRLSRNGGPVVLVTNPDAVDLLEGMLVSTYTHV